MEEVLTGNVTNPNLTPTLTHNRKPNSNPNQINKKSKKKQLMIKWRNVSLVDENKCKPKIWGQIWKLIPVFSRMQRTRSIRQHEYVFLKTGLKFTKKRF
jgi:hypothetical protein